MTAVYILTIIFGLCVGSFLNVVIYRVPNGMNIAKPASHCPKCNNPIKWYDNIPVLSYIFLGGKCRHCKTHISFRYTVVELLNALMWFLAAYFFWEKSIFFACTLMATLSVLICIFFVDLEHMIIPDSFQLALLVCAIVMIFAEVNENNTFVSKLIGFAVSGGLFLLIHYCAIRFFKKEAIGGGDIKLFAVAGLLLGIQNVFLAIALAAVSACIVLLVVRVCKNFGKEQEYPFAPFICFGITICLFFGSDIINWYLSLLS